MNYPKRTLTIPVIYYSSTNYKGEKVYQYDWESMADAFEDALCELDDSVVVMCSVESDCTQVQWKEENGRQA